MIGIIINDGFVILRRVLCVHGKCHSRACIRMIEEHMEQPKDIIQNELTAVPPKFFDIKNHALGIVTQTMYNFLKMLSLTCYDRNFQNQKYPKLQCLFYNDLGRFWVYK